MTAPQAQTQIQRLRQAIEPHVPELEATAALSFGLFLLAGSFKQADLLSWIPFDLTVAFLAICGLAALGLVVVDPRRLRGLRGGLLLALVFVLFAAGLFGSEPGYGHSKVIRLYTVTLFAAGAPFVIVATAETRRLLLRTFLVVGLVLAVVAFVAYAFGDPRPRRLRVPGTNEATVGRTAALALAALLAMPLRSLDRRLRIALTGLVAAGLVFAGSLAPMLGVMVTVAVLGFRGAFRVEWRAIIRVSAFLAATFTLLVLVGPIDSAGRIIQFAGGNVGESGTARLDAFSSSVEVVGQEPLGIGWGEFSNEVEVEVWEGFDRQFAHNIVIEVLLEAGWVPGVVFSAVVVMALMTAVRAGREDETVEGVLAVLVLALVIALFSGDVNDNRVLFAALGMAFALELGVPGSTGDAS
ncbi:MAG: O-antigen ligase family protein [Acidimicrobiia bacterium]|nr:O-antigen ligase family protein [Acidimicrobiia bacterium]